ncbi:hypothetical protein [Fluviispira vulneris]|uniref:hypothetical protein n=1 Tax=Fluviispira vulneris TaxID=2763012 RepID=UPI00164406CD|nr:hypothetical protein [Fluviispira vulneris]
MTTLLQFKELLISSPQTSSIDMIKYEQEIKNSIQYLNSDTAKDSLSIDAYWPKWNSPWWHMLLLHEMGETQKIPKDIIEKLVKALDKLPLKIFVLHPHENPEGLYLPFAASCHCALGCIYQVLSASEVDVDKVLPWIRPWFLKYQMSDGGLNCDETAYLQKDECPSSMVGTISPFESILLYTKCAWTDEEVIFLDKCAQFLINRKLMHGSHTKHNFEEKLNEDIWLKLCFPRFYLYDVLRGLSVLVKWALLRTQPLPINSIFPVVKYLTETFPDGIIKNLRLSYEGEGSLSPTETDKKLRHQAAITFPLLEKVSTIGEISPNLTRYWNETKINLVSLIERNLIN